jgi:preprotein translocase subunit SecG
VLVELELVQVLMLVLVLVLAVVVVLVQREGASTVACHCAANGGSASSVRGTACSGYTCRLLSPVGIRALK